MMSSERLRRLRCGFICVVLSSLLPLLSLYYSKEDNKTIIEPKQRPNWNPRNISCDVKKNVGKRKSVWNVTKAEPLKFLSNYKNPCFFDNVTLSKKLQPGRTVPKLKCLPYFFIVGFPKSGTTDVFSRLQKHPDIIINHSKEPNFYRAGMLASDFSKALESYTKSFEKSTHTLAKLISPALCQGLFPYHYGVTGEASVDTAFDHPRWWDFPGNENCLEPILTNADYLHLLVPNLKVIFLVRDPVERLYSDYIYEARFLKYNISVENFHTTTLEVIRNHKICRAKFPIRACVYNRSIEPYKLRLRVGLYHIFISDWIDVFSRDQILVIRMEDMNTVNIRKVYRQILQFLDLRPFTKEEETTILHTGHVNTRSNSEGKIGNMWPKTKKLLNDFYKSYNLKLANLLGDDRFLWND